MPSLVGQVIMTLMDAAGNPSVAITWFFNPNTSALRNNPNPWTSPDGTVWPAGSGAVIGDNLTGKEVIMRINDAAGAMVRRVRLPAGGRAVTAAQLASAPPPDGPYTVTQDFSGLTFDLS